MFVVFSGLISAASGTRPKATHPDAFGVGCAFLGVGTLFGVGLKGNQWEHHFGVLTHIQFLSRVGQNQTVFHGQMVSW